MGAHVEKAATLAREYGLPISRIRIIKEMALRSRRSAVRSIPMSQCGESINNSTRRAIGATGLASRVGMSFNHPLPLPTYPSPK
jgi:hypothetical protein